MLSSVCMPNVSSEVDGITLMVLLQPKLPDGAIVNGELTSARVWVVYSNRRYEISRRKEGQGACFDFNPPIPLAVAKLSANARPGANQRPAVVADRLATLLSDYWYLAVILAALLFLFFKRSGSAAEEPGAAPRAEQTLLISVLPDLTDELEKLLTSKGEADLAGQVPRLRIVDRCRCGDDFCSTFYVQPKPEGAYGPGHRNVVLDPRVGTLVLDVVNEEIAAIEVLYRDDVRDRLHALLP